MTDVTPDDALPAELFIKNLSGEVQRLADIAGRMDDLVADMIAGNASPDQLAELQQIDHLRQALEAIATLTANVTSRCPDDMAGTMSRRSLAEGVTLESVRDACLFGPLEPSVQDPTCDHKMSTADFLF